LTHLVIVNCLNAVKVSVKHQLTQQISKHNHW